MPWTSWGTRHRPLLLIVTVFSLSLITVPLTSDPGLPHQVANVIPGDQATTPLTSSAPVLSGSEDVSSLAAVLSYSGRTSRPPHTSSRPRRQILQHPYCTSCPSRCALDSTTCDSTTCDSTGQLIVFSKWYQKTPGWAWTTYPAGLGRIFINLWQGGLV